MPDNNNSGPSSDPFNFNTAQNYTVAVTADTKQAEDALFNVEKLGDRVSANLVSGIEAVAIKGKSVESVLKSLALSFSSAILKQAFAPLQNIISGAASGLLKGFLPFANGGVLRSGTPVPFASGGVISSPIAFPLSGGRSGIAGERGAEAIMPLARGPDGRLGVVAQGGRNAPSITINISTPDVDSFSRSQTQVAAMIARAASLGQRNL
jgi:phage-related minor tail protein